MAEFKVFCDETRKGRVDKDGAPLECYTFAVNGAPSMKWFKPCLLPREQLPPAYDAALPTEEYYVRRCIGRLRQGRSREAFGGPSLAMGPGGVLVQQQAAPARGTVCRCDQTRRWKYTIDGREAPDTYPTEAQAREACAAAAFMSRGKLGRFAEAAEAFRQCHGKGCEVRVEGRGVVAVAEGCGTRYAVGFDAQGVRFKALAPARQVATAEQGK